MTAQTILPANSVTGGFDVDNSAMFDGTSNYIHNTPGSAGNTKLWTWSAWFKKVTVGEDLGVFGQYIDANNYFRIKFRDDDRLQVDQYTSGTHVVNFILTQQLRDTSAWYHLVVAYDSAQGTEANRVKIYINGTRVTAFNTETYPDQNVVTTLPVDGTPIELGRTTDSQFFDGYFCQVCLIDGQALAPTSFGEFDSDSEIWIPIKVSGLTAGTNGFLYTFEQTAQLGKDTFSGNANFGTEENFGTINQKTDTCTNNFCIWNVAADNQDVTFGSGACKVVHGTATARRPVISTFGVAKGKWYWEWKAAGSPTAANMEVGIVNYASPTSQGRYLGQALTSDADFTTYIGDGNINVSGSASDSGTAYAGGNIIGVAVDVDNEKIYFYKNNTLINSGGTDYSGMTIGSGFIFMSNADRSGSASYTASVNFGQPVVANSSDAADGNGHGRFEYAPPSGFLALCTKNLAETG